MSKKFISSILEYDSSSDTTYLTHGIFRWYGKLVPQLVSDILDMYTEKDDLVLANFNGSGTIALESIIKGVNVVGTDINPLAILISKVKTTKLPDFNFDSLLNKIIDSSHEMEVDQSDIDKLYQPEKWYSGDTPIKLIKLKKAINKCCDNKDIRDMFLVSLLSIVRESSNVDSRSVNHIVYDKNRPLPNVEANFIREANKTFKAVKELDEYEVLGNSQFHLQDAKNIEQLNDESVDLVFSHPPYLNAINYYNIHRLSTDLMGVEYTEVRSEDLSGKKLEKFLEFMKEIFEEAQRVLKPGKRMITVIGDVRFQGNIVPLGVEFVNLVNQLGFELEDLFIWILNKKAGMSVTRRGNHIDHNFVIVAKKKEVKE